ARRASLYNPRRHGCARGANSHGTCWSGMTDMRRVAIPAVLALMGLGAAFALQRAGAARVVLPAAPAVATEQARIRVVTLTTALVQPWALAFLPDGDILVTE